MKCKVYDTKMKCEVFRVYDQKGCDTCQHEIKLDHNEIVTLLNRRVSMNANEVDSITELKIMVAQLLTTEDLEVTKKDIIELLNKQA